MRHRFWHRAVGKSLPARRLIKRPFVRQSNLCPKTLAHEARGGRSGAPFELQTMLPLTLHASMGLLGGVVRKLKPDVLGIEPEKISKCIGRAQTGARHLAAIQPEDVLEDHVIFVER